MSDSTTVADIVPIVRDNINRESRFMTDKARYYVGIGATFAEHGSVDHTAKEYVRGDIHTNTVEGYYSICKRHEGRLISTEREAYDHRRSSISAKKLRCLVEDQERAGLAIERMKGKRLTYRQPHG